MAVCDKCNGNPKNITRDQFGEVLWIQYCDKCKGHGEVDWVEEVVGSSRDREHSIDDLIMKPKRCEMSLQELIKNDMQFAMKNKKDTLQHLKVILGEIQRQPKKEITDSEIIKILKKLKKNEEELLNVQKADDSFIHLVGSYIPEEMDKEEIQKWIQENIDFSQLKNKMQAVGQVKKALGEKVDGKIVSDIIKEM